MGVIPASIKTLVLQYPTRTPKDPSKYKYVDAVMKGLPGTPCCVQISHALNMCGVFVPQSSYRRTPNPKVGVNGRMCSYLPATDELEYFLHTTYGEPETISGDAKNPRSVTQIQSYIKDRPGLLIFRHGDFRAVPPPGKFEHTEFWDGKGIIQTDISSDLFKCPRVLFWDTNDPAKFLVDYMRTQP